MPADSKNPSTLGGSILKVIHDDKTKAKAGTTHPAPVVVPSSKHLHIPGLDDCLGHGYDVFGKYASPDFLKAQIFDLSSEGFVDQQVYDDSLPQVRSNVAGAFTTLPTELKLIYAMPPRVQFTALYEPDLEYSTGGSMSAEQKTLAANVNIQGSYGLFSGEFSARYDSSVASLSTARFYSMTAVIRYYNLSLVNYPLDLRSFVIPDVRKTLNDASITPAQIFDKYGTHYLYAVTIGSKIVYGQTVDTSKTTTGYDAAVEMQAKYGEPGAEIGGSAGVKVTQSNEQATDSMTVKFYGAGISDAQIDAMDQTLNAAQAQASAPASTSATAAGSAADPTVPGPLDCLKEGWHNPTLIDFPEDALKPIWELCDTPARQQELQKAFAAYAQTHPSILGGTAELTPMYLQSATEAGSTYYRLSANRTDAVVDKVSWSSGSGTPGPALYLFNEQKTGTVPLYEYHWAGRLPGTWVIPGVSVPGSLFPRYETSRWETYLGRYAQAWKKASGNPLGWVYDGLEAAPADDFADVYVYVPDQARVILSFLYSTDSADGRDNNAWRPYQGVSDDVPPVTGHGVVGSGFELPPSTETDTIAVLELQNNVHWRAPTMTG